MVPDAQIIIVKSSGSDSSDTSSHEDRMQRRNSARLSRRHVLAAVAVAAVLACCWALAGLTASDGATEELDWEGADSRTSAIARRLGEQERPSSCRTVQEGDPCHRRIVAMKRDVKEYSKRYPELTEKSTVEEIQAVLHNDPFVDCPQPCNIAQDATVSAASATDPLSEPIGMAPMLGWQPSGRVVGQGQWCSANEPTPGWALKGCGNLLNLTGMTNATLEIKVLTYNLFWWSLFDMRRGAGGSAGKLIAAASGEQRFDLMAFQECESVWWVLTDTGMKDEYDAVVGPHALCIAYKKANWNLIASSSQNVAEDRWDQWYGTRAGMWVRLNHTVTGQGVFFINHHGPLPLNSGGKCGGEATAYNLLHVIAGEAQPGDAIILVGDFNAGPTSVTLQSLGGRLHNVYTGSSFGGVDNILSSCSNVTSVRNLGNGGSDHDALMAVIQL